MKKGKTIIFALTLVLLGSLSSAVYGAGESGGDAAAISENVFGFSFVGKGINLTDEQKSEIEKKMAEIKAIVESGMTEEEKAELEKRQGEHKFLFRTELTEEQKAQMEARRAEQKAKWDALSNEQKEELYALQDKTIDAQMAVIDKCLALGLIDQEAAQAMKDKLSEAKTLIRENGEKGMFGMGGLPLKAYPSDG